jgi:hypothetical protein
VVVPSDQPAGRCRAGEFRINAEVSQVAVQARFVRSDQDVRPLDVPVHDSGGVGGVQRSRNLPHDLAGMLGREMACRCQGVGQVAALDQPHVDKEVPVDLTEVVDGDDVGFGQPGGT